MDEEERKARDHQLRSSIHTKLIESGEYERCAQPPDQATVCPLCCERRVRFLPERALRCWHRLKEMLKQKLVDSGWREDLKQYTMGAPELSCQPPFRPQAQSCRVL